MAAAAVSPELALVDPELRQAALSELAPVEPFQFLTLVAPRRHPDLDRFGFLADSRDAASVELQPARWVAAVAYAGSALARTVVVDALVVLGIAAAVALTQIG